MKIEFNHDDLPNSIPPDIALCLYRIVQEALRNVVKHSGAQNCEVDLSGAVDGIRLRVLDNGVGFDPAIAGSQGGLGLISMRERLRAVRGEIAITAKPQVGTEIVVQISLAN